MNLSRFFLFACAHTTELKSQNSRLKVWLSFQGCTLGQPPETVLIYLFVLPYFCLNQYWIEKWQVFKLKKFFLANFYSEFCLMKAVPFSIENGDYQMKEKKQAQSEDRLQTNNTVLIVCRTWITIIQLFYVYEEIEQTPQRKRTCH